MRTPVARPGRRKPNSFEYSRKAVAKTKKSNLYKPTMRKVGNVIYVSYGVEKRYPLSRRMIFTIVLIFLGILAGAVPYAHNTRVQREINVTRVAINNQRESNRIARANITERYTLAEIERIATERLGMAPPDPAQIITIYVPRQGQVILNHEPLPESPNFFLNRFIDFFARAFRW